jgi:hydroxymethylbilane synthase
MMYCKIGTRASPLALTQARLVKKALLTAHGDNTLHVDIVVMNTAGDKLKNRPLSDFGGKGLFTKELEEGLYDRTIDVAVHSAKDMATLLPQGLKLACVLPREEVEDVLISRQGQSLMDLPRGALVGTASLRRQALVSHYRPDIRIELLRGNVQSRLRKLQEGPMEATLLAYAGLKRLAHTEVATQILPVHQFTPAVGQGALALEIREDDETASRLIAPLNCSESFTALQCERAFLKVLDGSCRTPIGGLARCQNGQLVFQGFVARPDGTEILRTERSGPIEHAIDFGTQAGEELKAQMPPGFLDSL